MSMHVCINSEHFSSVFSRCHLKISRLAGNFADLPKTLVADCRTGLDSLFLYHPTHRPFKNNGVLQPCTHGGAVLRGVKWKPEGKQLAGGP